MQLAVSMFLPSWFYLAGSKIPLGARKRTCLFGPHPLSAAVRLGRRSRRQGPCALTCFALLCPRHRHSHVCCVCGGTALRLRGTALGGAAQTNPPSVSVGMPLPQEASPISLLLLDCHSSSRAYAAPLQRKQRPRCSPTPLPVPLRRPATACNSARPRRPTSTKWLRQAHILSGRLPFTCTRLRCPQALLAPPPLAMRVRPHCTQGAGRAACACSSGLPIHRSHTAHIAFLLAHPLPPLERSRALVRAQHQYFFLPDFRASARALCWTHAFRACMPLKTKTVTHHQQSLSGEFMGLRR